MSIRPEISTFSLPTLFGLFGSKKEPVLNDLLKKLESRDLEDADLAQGNAILRRAIHEGVPFPDLVNETPIYVTCAMLLGDYDQDHEGTDSNVWKMSGLWDFSEKIDGSLPWPANVFLNYLVSGRPLFGKAIQTDWSHYAYLSYAENLVLCKNLQELAGMDGDSNEMRDQLLLWLETGKAAKKDIWMFTL